MNSENIIDPDELLPIIFENACKENDKSYIYNALNGVRPGNI